VLHKRAVLRQLAHNEFAIDFGWVATIRCPGAQCSGLIDVECMQQFASPDLIGIFQRFAVARRAQIDAAAELTRELARRNAQQIESANAEPRDPQGRLWCAIRRRHALRALRRVGGRAGGARAPALHRVPAAVLLDVHDVASASLRVRLLRRKSTISVIAGGEALHCS
jgi:hypothetical protein